MVESSAANDVPSAEFRAISVAEVQAFRAAVLRPPDKQYAAYQRDDAPQTLHLGAFVGPRLAAVATICQEEVSGGSEHGGASSWRLRGMATAEEFRGHGFGKRLAEECVAHARSHGGSLVWCSARMGAVGFYRGLGFKGHGEPFRLPAYSEASYVLMTRVL